MDFFKQYEKWIADCKEELKEMDFAFTSEKVEICENGQVYFGNLHITEPHFVTPWCESIHFVD